MPNTDPAVDNEAVVELVNRRRRQRGGTSEGDRDASAATAPAANWRTWRNWRQPAWWHSATTATRLRRGPDATGADLQPGPRRSHQQPLSGPRPMPLRRHGRGLGQQPAWPTGHSGGGRGGHGGAGHRAGRTDRRPAPPGPSQQRGQRIHGARGQGTRHRRDRRGFVPITCG